ncbi:hypothetical protein BDP81DRAFT_505281 [Colletotrichum phormii]|uniref:Ubiquitin-like protease family profile domain-containing protein n=1 Tax=Colletotrichum phormii TaxID=359342 RepID=A0AAJ0A309_9PEZI|nr:uncharacterized protein BDP81DRAFT_505281 [Colletotrichum phormii]KAK1641519.1 hypothetical protein BDP81DRAFT_505281 [Colletotrichum phormii]
MINAIHRFFQRPTPVRVHPIGHFTAYGAFSSENGSGHTRQTPTFNRLDHRTGSYLETDKRQLSPASAASSTIVVQAELPERTFLSKRSSAAPAASPDLEFALGANELSVAEKRPASPLPSIPKRQRLATSPQASLDRFDSRRLAHDQHVKEGIIYQVIKAAAALCPISVRVLDPLLLNGQESPKDLVDDLAANAGSIILAPINLDTHTHWILAVISENVVTIFDSKSASTDEGAVRRTLGHLLPHFGCDAAFAFHQCPEQTKDADSGVASIVNALHIISGQPIPAITDYGIWRPVLAALANGAHHGSLLSDIKLQAPSVSTESIAIPPMLPPTMTPADYQFWHKQQATFMEDVARVVKEQHNKMWSEGLQVEAELNGMRDLLQSLSRAGTQQWRPLLAVSPPSDGDLDEVDEVEKEVLHCQSALEQLESCRISDTSMTRKLRLRLTTLSGLRSRRDTIRESVASLTTVVTGDLAKMKTHLEELKAWGEEIVPSAA